MDEEDVCRLHFSNPGDITHELMAMPFFEIVKGWAVNRFPLTNPGRPRVHLNTRYRVPLDFCAHKSVALFDEAVVFDVFSQ